MPGKFMTYTLKYFLEDDAEAEVVSLFSISGDRVKKGADLLEITTDKAAFLIECPADGILTDLFIAPGDTLGPKSPLFAIASIPSLPEDG